MAEPLGVQIEKLSPKAGDLLVVRYTNQSPPHLQEIGHSLRDHLDHQGLSGVGVLLIGPHVEVALIDERAMAELGWVRKPDDPSVVPAG